MVNCVYCATCGVRVKEGKIFCDKVCYFSRKNYRKHSQETKDKIAKGNSKPLTEERKKNISVAKTFMPTPELLQELEKLWELKYFNPEVIKDLCSVKMGGRVYRRLFADYCKVEQYKFMSPKWYPEHYERLIELTSQNVYINDIAKELGFGKKQVVCTALKLGLKVNNRNPNAYADVISIIEKQVVEWIRKAGFEVIPQYPLGNFLFDCHIKNTRILIEVNGDYWHCNPKVYSKAINKMQKDAQRRDRAKKSIAAKNDYYLIVVWEQDIKTSPDKTKKWILNKVKQNA